MDNAGAMRFVEGVDYFDRNSPELLHGQRAALQPLAQCFAFQVFHDQEIGTVLPADIVQHTDMRMLKHRDSSRLALEALLQFGIAAQSRGKNLNGDRAVQSGIARAIHLTHAADTQR
jgi:hypothetical protein